MDRQKNEGMALLTVLIVSLLVAGLIGMMASRTTMDSLLTQSYVQNVRATEASAAGLERGIDQVYGQFNGGTMSDFTNYLGTITTSAGTGLALGVTGDLPGLATTLGNGTRIDNVSVTRALNGQDFIVQSTGSSGGVTMTSVAGGRVGGQPFSGFGYAVLANNINCIMCHATFDNVDRVNNTDPNLNGTFDRIKVASLESLLVRVGKAHSSLAGSYYTRGVITDKQGSPLSDLVGSGVTGREFDADGLLLEDGSGNMTPHELGLTGTDPSTGLYDANGYLYTDYPTVEAEMTDGKLPEKFPAVVPDSNGDKMVNGTEFADLKASKGTGSMTGGVQFGVAPGANYSGTGLPAGSNGAATSLGSAGDYTGNVFMLGTAADPIVIDGPIFIEGDVVIRGPIEGKGQIFASGNMYFLGDTTYNDTGGAYGTNGGPAGSDENLVAYAAGGNIQIGDYLSPKKTIGQVWDPKKKKWKSTGVTYDVMSPEALTADTIDTGGPPNSGNPASFTMSEVTLFNKIEYQKNQADPTYIPRYYQLREGDPIYRFDHADPTKEHGSSYDSAFKEITAAELTASGAGIVSLAPQTASNGSPWLSELFLKKAWQDDELSRDPNGQPFQIDGLLYTNNSIFALARSNEKHNSRTYGQLKVRGGMVAADLGILSSGDGGALTASQEALFGLDDSGQGRGFVMEYDKRVNGFLSIEDMGNLGYTKRVRVFLPNV